MKKKVKNSGRSQSPAQTQNPQKAHPHPPRGGGGGGWWPKMLKFGANPPTHPYTHPRPPPQGGGVFCPRSNSLVRGPTQGAFIRRTTAGPGLSTKTICSTHGITHYWTSVTAECLATHKPTSQFLGASIADLAIYIYI